MLSSAPQRAEYISSLSTGGGIRRLRRRSTFTETRDPKSEKARSLLASAKALRDQGNRSAAAAKLDLALQFEPDSKVLAAERAALAAEEEARAPKREAGTGES